jgi:hypothetical protein
MNSDIRHRIRLAGESGFTMIVTIGVLFVSSLLLTATFMAARNDIHLSQTDTASKKAYYAAQAGISNYAFHLAANSNYWTLCKAEGNEALNLVGEKPLKTRLVPGTTDEKYAIQLVPALTAPALDNHCDTANPVGTMIEGGSNAGGTFRIQSTGWSGNQERTITTTFGHTSFLEFLYYTKYETLDPATAAKPEKACEAYFPERPGSCPTIQFISTDEVKGPMHTEDKVSVCSTPTFGRNKNDKIEFRLGHQAGGGGCTDSPKFWEGQPIPLAEVVSIKPPPSNAELKEIAGLKFSGKVAIVLEGESMQVTHYTLVEGKIVEKIEKVAFPKNGVVYVSNEKCVLAYKPYGPSYKEDVGCGNIYVKGKYTAPLTIAAENDIVVNGNIEPPLSGESPTTNAVLGLVANNFVRVFHPLTGERGSEFGSCGGSSKSAEDMANPTIWAAILAVNHSFIVDNFDCGSPMEHLNVHGAIAQVFRGTVGTHSGESVVSGYSKNYNYDDRLAVESPPSFLSPIAAVWVAKRETLSPNP